MTINEAAKDFAARMGTIIVALPKRQPELFILVGVLAVILLLTQGR